MIFAGAASQLKLKLQLQLVDALLDGDAAVLSRAPSIVLRRPSRRMTTPTYPGSAKLLLIADRKSKTNAKSMQDSSLEGDLQLPALHLAPSSPGVPASLASKNAMLPKHILALSQ